MAFRETNPNIQKTRSASDSSDVEAWKVSKPKGIGKNQSFPIVSLVRPTSGGKENIPPAVGKFEIFQDNVESPSSKVVAIDEGKIGSFLTAKWEKESSPESTGVLKGPPNIQRSHHHIDHSLLSKVPSGSAWAKSPWNDKSTTQTVTDRPSSPLKTTTESAFVKRSDGRFAVSRGQEKKSFRVKEQSKNHFETGTVRLDRLGKARRGAGLLGSSNGRHHTHQSSSGLSDGSRRQFSSQRTDSNKSFSAAARQNMNRPVPPSKARPWLCAPNTTTQNIHNTSDILPSAKTQNHPKTYNTQSIKMLTASQDEDAPAKAEFLLRQMLCDYHEGLTETPPDGGCFNSVVHAYACRGNASKAEEVLTLMQWHGTVAIDQRIFTSVMYAWQCSDRKYEAPDACE